MYCLGEDTVKQADWPGVAVTWALSVIRADGDPEQEKTGLGEEERGLVFSFCRVTVTILFSSNCY